VKISKATPQQRDSKYLIKPQRSNVTRSGGQFIHMRAKEKQTFENKPLPDQKKFLNRS